MRGDNEIVAIMMERLHEGNVLTITSGRGRFIIDPWTGDAACSPSAALIARMSDEERQRMAFWATDEKACALGIDPFADVRQARTDGTSAVDGDAELANMMGLLVAYLGLDAGPAMAVKMTEYLVRLVSYVPGMTLVDMDALIESPDGIRMGLSFVPDDDEEKPRMEQWLLGSLSRYANDMRQSLSVLWNESDLRHMLGQTNPRGMAYYLANEGILLVRVPNEWFMAPFCQELLLRASNLTDGPVVNWAYRPAAEIAATLLEDDGTLYSIMGRTEITTRSPCDRVGKLFITDRHIRQRARLIAAGDRDGWMEFYGFACTEY